MLRIMFVWTIFSAVNHPMVFAVVVVVIVVVVGCGGGCCCGTFGSFVFHRHGHLVLAVTNYALLFPRFEGLTLNLPKNLNFAFLLCQTNVADTYCFLSLPFNRSSAER